MGPESITALARWPNPNISIVFWIQLLQMVIDLFFHLSCCLMGSMEHCWLYLLKQFVIAYIGSSLTIFQIKKAKIIKINRLPNISRCTFSRDYKSFFWNYFF